MTSSTTLFWIRVHAERAIEACSEALQENLVDADGADSPQARVLLAGALKASKKLMEHLDQNYDFGGLAGPLATLKEDSCLE